jgi:hypothetical protein
MAKRVKVNRDVDAFQDQAIAMHWSDGLPLIPPTSDRVESMLAGTDWPPEVVVTHMPPLYSECTIEKIAINAVMAGCLPSYMPVLIAAVEATAIPQFNAFSVQTTTHPCGVMVLVNGPIRARIGLNSGAGAFGPGTRSNASIGRAVRLVLQNVGGAYPGVTDMSTQGSPAKFTFCFAEAEESSPWPPYHVSLGYQALDSVVTIHAAENPNEINDHVSLDPSGLLVTFCETIASVGKNNAYSDFCQYFVAVCPEHANLLSKFGFSRKELQRALYERARIPYGVWRSGGTFRAAEAKTIVPLPPWRIWSDDEARVPMSADADGVHIVVVGGAGRHSAWMPSLGPSRPVSKLVTTSDGSPWMPPE